MNIIPDHVDLLAGVRRANADLAREVKKLQDSITTDVRLVKYSWADGGVRSYYLARGVWVEAYPGVRIMLIDDSHHCTACPIGAYDFGQSGCTRVLLDCNGRVPKHNHPHDEKMTVIRGYAEVWCDAIPGGRQIVHASESLIFPKNEDHELEMHGMFVICWHPPIPRAENDKKIDSKT